MAEKEQYPKAEVDYVLTGENTGSSTTVFLAGKKYAETRPAEEEVSLNVEFGKNVILMKFGRTILETMQFPEIMHEVDVMGDSIDENIKQLSHGKLLQDVKISRRATGNIPDQE